MSFLGMGTFEILVILLVAFIFLGPERMIDAGRILGKWTGELRRMGSTVQAEMEDLTNVGDPLASRRPPTQNKTQGDTSETPLDQDHPADTSDSAEPVQHVAGNHQPVRPEDSPELAEGHVEGQPSRHDPNSARKEESA